MCSFCGEKFVGRFIYISDARLKVAPSLFLESIYLNLLSIKLVSRVPAYVPACVRAPGRVRALRMRACVHLIAQCLQTILI